jgi:hypothetical protein
MDAELCSCLNSAWSAKGLFVMNADDGTLIDICAVIDTAPFSGVVNLSPALYPPTIDGFKSLYKVLKDQVSQLGFDLNICRSRAKGTEQHIGCARSRQFFIKKGSAGEQLIEQSHVDQFTYKKGIKEPAMRGYNSNVVRKDGKKLPRRTNTAWPLNANDKCSFNFLIKRNSTHWYLRNGVGNYHHTGHRKRIHQTNVSTLSVPENLLITNMDGSQLTTMAIRQFFFKIPKP